MAIATIFAVCSSESSMPATLGGRPDVGRAVACPRGEEETVTTPEERERRACRALSSVPDEALTFSDEVLRDDVRLLFPGGLLLTGRRQVLAAMAGPPWDTHELTGLDVLRPTDEVAVVSYGVEASRAGTPYS